MTTGEKLLCNRLYELIPEEAGDLLLPLMKEMQIDLCNLQNQKCLLFTILCQVCLIFGVKPDLKLCTVLTRC